jgi:outer membrane protein OmpA-like peptidoglycan-associated protein/subtilisin family serine protease
MTSGDTYFGADLELDAVDAESLPARDAVATDQRRPEDLAMTGRGIVIGVVDWGFDFRHPDFRRPDGSTRILALWDQRGGKQASSPQPYGYGTLHTREAINKALGEKDPYAALQYHPADADTGIGCHGTHVASIAAGTGSEERPAGIAPEADLVFVHNAPWDGLESGKLGDSVTLLEAIDFIAHTAPGRPWVVNLSMGRHGEQHDGTTLIEQGLDAAVRAAAGRAICLSAGNYYNKRTHASGQLRPTQSRTLEWVVNEPHPSDYNQLEVWYSAQDKFEVTVHSPDGSIAAQARLGEKVKLLSAGKEIGNLYHRAQEPNTLDHHITVYLYKTAPAGEWTVTLNGTDVIHGNYHAWIEREVSCPKCQSHFRAEDADPTSTTGTICNGRRTIAVGAYDAHDPAHRIGVFSSVGPTRDGRLKPDLSAPGVSVLAARSAQREHWEDTPLSTRMSGTSMAAPHVTGAVALAFQAAVRPLRIEETHNLLLGSARRAEGDNRDGDRIGIGFLDIAGFVDAAGKVDNGQRTFTPVRELPSASVARAPAREAVAVHAARPEHPVRHAGLEPAREAESLRPTPGLKVGDDSEAATIDAEVDLLERRKHVVEPSGDPQPIDAETVEQATAITAFSGRDASAGEFARSFIEATPAEYLYLTSLGVGGRGAATAEALPMPSPQPPTSVGGIAWLERVATGFAPEDEPAGGACRVVDQFALNRAEIPPMHQQAIAQAAHDILAGRTTRVRVIGHASQDGDVLYNDRIARQRAENVAAALRALMESSRSGASAGVSLGIESRGEHEPVSRDPARNRRVEICFASPAPVTVSTVTPATLEQRLRALLGASMLLAGNRGAPFTAAALPSGLPASGRIWHYALGFNSGGVLQATDVTCQVTHAGGHTMAMGVLDEVTWEDPLVRFPGGAPLTLPLRAAYLLGSFQTGGGHIAHLTHRLWRLESDHDIGTAAVFGFDLGNPAAPAPLRRFDELSREAPTGRGARVLVVCELVLCQSRADFEPTGLLDAARVYPIAEIITDGEADIQMAVNLRRPDRSAMDHGWFGGGNHIPSVYADRNEGDGLMAFVASRVVGGSALLPTWENIFDYFDRNASRASLRATGVDPALTGTRTNGTDREVVNRVTGSYGPSTVTKRPRQGEFDNVHIAPQMEVSLGAVPILFSGLGPLGVSMAPLCAHDCFHMHWRWGRGYVREHNLGWGPSGPYTEAGAPMVALNQKVEIELPAGHAGVRYRALSGRQPGGDWAVVMPHGAGYALQLRFDPVAFLPRLLAVLPVAMSPMARAILAWVASNPDRAWAWIYFFFQYTPTPHAPHFKEAVLLHSLAALRRL